VPHGAAWHLLLSLEFAEAMTDVGRKALWVIRELGLPAIAKACVSCRSARHHPTGKFRVNANGKLLDVWMLICCELCGRTSKIPVYERIHVRALESGFGLSRSAVRNMVDSGRIRLPMAVDAKAREDFTLFVITGPPSLGWPVPGGAERSDVRQ